MAEISTARGLAAADHDADIGGAITHGTCGCCAESRVVDARGRVGAVVDDGVSRFAQPRDQVLFQLEAGVIRAQRNGCHVDECRTVSDRRP